MPKTIRNSAAREAYLELIRVQTRLQGEFEDLFKAAGLTHTQFNVLRVLLTGPAQGLPCQRIGESLIHRVPDVTRLIDRMEAAGLVQRSRDSEDRRVVLVRVTAQGRKAAEGLYGAVDSLHRAQMRPLNSDQIATLNELLGMLVDRG
ncbi:MarR family winged helix-turn-helix transcriptional regulator [Engelhardtia mirabilis]|uniref:HTH-type transcriptional regulator MgrA n=1 Tax=Engelhardtia mirabilis TaxID=2528011 RepID=A0A518BDU6_9BACT|nr:HTH-type transcriptional regulator MgrA [Planctomycetes bacterium Pla133]QDU99485.1 HTH-type transcriptional regulator MgrA [Planctomycetes bacterium Pla86]